MSSPSKRSTRSAATPGRATRSSQQQPSSPAPGPSNAAAAARTPRQTRTSQLASSPLFYQSSSPGPGANRASSPLRQQTETQSTGDRTPRASGALMGDSSPIRYDPSSSPGHQLTQQSDIRSDSSALFVGSQRSTNIRSHRGDINPDVVRTPRVPRRIVLDPSGRVVQDGSTLGSDAASFANNNPHTSEADALGGPSQSLVWGTTVSLEDSFASFRDFLRNFTRKYRMWADGVTEAETNDNPEADSKTYWEAMETMLLLGTNKMYLDLRDLKAYPRTVKLWHQCQAYPTEIIPVMDQCVHDCMIELAQVEMASQRAASHNASGSSAAPQASQSSEIAFPSSDHPEEPSTPRPAQPQLTLEDEIMKQQYLVRPWGSEKTVNLRDLNPSDMDKLISIKGLVIRATPVIPDMKQAFFKCGVCGHSVTVELDRGKIREPTECPRNRCKQKNSMQIIHNRCEFEDKQVIKLQETPDAVPAGQTPHSVSVCVYNELVDFCKAGDRVELTGIYKVTPVRVNPRMRTVKSVHKTYVDVVHVQKVDKKRMGADPTTLDLAEEEEAHASGQSLDEIKKVTPAEEEKIKETAARPDIYDLLSRSLAPSIYEMDDVKKGILLQLFGGTNKTFEKGASPRYRGDINVLLCGDPSTSKSQILSYVHRIAPRGVYTSGKGSSAVGLTAYVTRDPETRQLVLESGALVLSDGGVCCIDEFDKMNESTRSVLHEVMEQQTVSVAKAGIITTLNARTSILASANPIGSRYNPDMSVPQNIDLPPTLLSRFDLVYLILDRVDEKTDQRLARHLLSMYLEDKPEMAQTNNDILPIEFLTSYISYARANIHPTITPAAGQALVEAYVEMRRLGQDVRAAEKRITATTRQLESAIRLSEAHAKMRLSETVTPEDVHEAVRLIRSALKTAATDAQGRIDMSLLTEGTSAVERKRKADMKDGVVRLLDELTAGGQAVRFSEVARKFAEGAGVPVEPSEFAEVMRTLEMEGAVMISGEGARRSVRRVTASV
ncbi:MCM2/3/5 family-domain-containing protein [Staphylotrichum tortipilum]|uniref:DNA replication licensing factor MCM4 n=1 Tax=Staphylotrichum tortipilum TaxID=2831512 RepID=A0AAN6MPC5_9PEZI|nr:MCM2/3/5 family-domain-containing protein [Staphylotrichum longicolle]